MERKKARIDDILLGVDFGVDNASESLVVLGVCVCCLPCAAKHFSGAAGRISNGIRTHTYTSDEAMPRTTRWINSYGGTLSFCEFTSFVLLHVWSCCSCVATGRCWIDCLLFIVNVPQDRACWIFSFSSASRTKQFLKLAASPLGSFHIISDDAPSPVLYTACLVHVQFVAPINFSVGREKRVRRLLLLPTPAPGYCRRTSCMRDSLQRRLEPK